MTTIEMALFLFSKNRVFPVTKIVKTLKIIPKEKNNGWISFKDEGDYIHVFLTSHKDHHCRAFGARAFAVDICKADGSLYQRYGFSGVWESAITMHPLYTERESSDKIEGIKRFMFEQIEIAYKLEISQENNHTTSK